MNKRAIAILGAIFILIVGALGFLIYSRSQTSTPQTPVLENPVIETPVVEEPTQPEEPQQPTSGAIRLTDASDPVISPVLFFQGNGISYFSNSGQLFQTDLQINSGTALLSNKRELSIALKSNISKILWPLTGNNFIAEFNNGGKPSWSLYDSSKAAYADIPQNIYSIDWMPSGDKVVYIWNDSNGKSTMKIANPDTTGFQNIADMFQPDNIVNVSPDGSKITFYRNQTADNTKNLINMVSADGQNFSTPVKDGYNSGVLWSPDSKKFLFAKRDSGTQRFSLWMTDIATGEVKNLGVYTTVNKAVWSKDSQTVYAGVPTTGNAGQGLTQDVVHKITVATAQSQQFQTGIAVDLQSLFLSANEDILFFKNAQDNALYYISVQ